MNEQIFYVLDAWHHLPHRCPGEKPRGAGSSKKRGSHEA